MYVKHLFKVVPGNDQIFLRYFSCLRHLCISWIFRWLFYLVNIWSSHLPEISDPRCPPNQVWSQCGMNGCQACGIDIRVCLPGCSGPGCTCAPGYKLRSDGKCVLPEQCPCSPITPNAQKCKCPKNEIWVRCGHTLCESCKIYLEKIYCPKPPCKPGCRCLKGYRRNNAGNCIPKSQCKWACLCQIWQNVNGLKS
jgi:Trypsin Inhibitor like cysteine rich domain